MTSVLSSIASGLPHTIYQLAHDDLPGSGAGGVDPSKKRPEDRPESAHEAEPRTIGQIHTSQFSVNSNRLAIALQKLLKRNPELKLIKASFDSEKGFQETQDIGVVDENAKAFLSTPVKMGIFKPGDRYSTFSEGFGIGHYLSDFVDKGISREQKQDSRMSGYTSGSKDHHIDLFSDDLKFVFKIAEPGVLEINITDI